MAKVPSTYAENEGYTTSYNISFTTHDSKRPGGGPFLASIYNEQIFYLFIYFVQNTYGSFIFPTEMWLFQAVFCHAIG